MASSFSNAKLISAIFVDTISVALGRRGYAVQSGVERGILNGSSKVMLKKGVVEESSKKTSSSPWVPDPVTGYYMPENQAKEIDAAELRQVLLNHEIPRH